jgi:hypothetical protein
MIGTPSKKICGRRLDVRAGVLQWDTAGGSEGEILCNQATGLDTVRH